MPTKGDRLDPRAYFGFTGQPLAVPAESTPMPQQIRDRFARHGQEAFIPYIDPYQTLARSHGITRAGHALQIGDAENEFMGNLDAISSNPSGLQDFLKKHPAAALSPMVRTWQKTQQPIRKDPYEAMVAKEGATYLQAYREAVAAGQDPMEAFSEFRDIVKKETDAAEKTKDARLTFVKAGGDLEDFEELEKSGADEAEMLDFIRKKGKPLSATEAKKLAELQADLEAAERSVDSYEDNDAYVEEVIEVYGKKPETKEQWDEAYFKLKEKKAGPKRKKYEDYISILEENGKRIPKAKPLQTAPVPAAQAPVPTTPTAPVVPPAKAKAGLSPLSQVRQALKP